MVTLWERVHETSVARVRVRAGSGKITVNSRAFEAFFVREQDRNAVLTPLTQTDRVGSVDVSINVHGGGNTGQAGACKLGLARALKIYDSGLEEALRQAHLLTRTAA